MITDQSIETKKLHKANFCKNRFCPICAWRQTKKDALKISIIMEFIKKELDLDFIFLTLTAPNVKAENLNEEIKKYNKSFKKLAERKEFKKISKGYARKLEITYNQERNDYHPHFHVIIVVNKSYFKSRDYINKNKFLKLWQECMDDDSITQVDVRRIDTDDKKSISEIAKYGAKDSDYMYSQDVFDVFYKALKGKQLVTYSGVFKDALKDFKEGNLDKYKEVDLTEYVYSLCYKWNFKNSDYIQMELKELTEKEREKINKKLIDEIKIE
ncbi:protein rep [Paraclostridium sp. AKS46]|uniref:protein rep n=1 Tax=Paraclostridium bifermentans TaxID=1490 RepID=UPI001D0358B1|nr:protein rep [Paraclostridium bifermentans]MCU9810117.1 protein rep [Paraclostridium sp. AKS46]